MVDFENSKNFLEIDNQDLHNQLENLKEKIKVKEEEIAATLQKQKEEYEQLIRDKDDEVSNLVDQLVFENNELKKQIINLEIDNECLKENLDEMSTKLKELEKNNITPNDTFSNSNTIIDKNFYNNLKLIEESHNQKQKEIIDKYENLFKTLTREHKSIVSNMKRTCIENKNKIVNNKIDDEELLTLSQFEQHLTIFENKLKIIYEDMKNKENYIITIDQKYDKINEENKFLRRKVGEEKAFLLNKIEQIQNERDSHFANLAAKFEDEVKQKKFSMQDHIQKSFESNEKIILSLTKERDDLLKKCQEYERIINSMRKELGDNIKEREKLDKMLNYTEENIQKIHHESEIYNKKINDISIERDSYKKSNEDNLIKIQELVSKNIVLDMNCKNLTETLKRINQDKENIDHKLNSDFNSKIEELKSKLYEFQGLNSNLDYMLKQKEIIIQRLEEEKKSLVQKNNGIDSMKLELNELNTKILILNQEKDDEKRFKEKFQKNLTQTLEENEKYIQEIKKLKEFQLKNEENIKNLTFENSSLKRSSVTENEIYKNKEITEKSNKIMILENINADLRKEIVILKQNIFKIHESLKSLNDKTRYKISSNNSDDFALIDEINQYINELATKKAAFFDENERENKIKEENEKLKKLINELNEETFKKDEDISILKKKLLYSNINISNSYFKSTEGNKSTVNSLYESLIVFVKNLNLKYLLDIYEKKIEFEDEKQKIIIDKKLAGDVLYKNKKIEQAMIDIKEIKTKCESLFVTYEKRSKAYLTHEELSVWYVNFKTYFEEIIEYIFSSITNYKVEANEEITIFKIPTLIYHGILDKVNDLLSNYDSKINYALGEYAKNSNLIKNALEILINTTKIDNELCDRLIKNPITSKFI